MSPDSPETRLGRLETAVARLEQRTDDLSTDVRTLTPLIVSVAELRLNVAQILAEQRATRVAIQDRQHEASRDDKAFRRAFYLAGSTVVLSSLGALILAIVQGGHP